MTTEAHPDDRYLHKPSSIMFHVRKWIEEQGQGLNGLTVVDVPAGVGLTSSLLARHGATPVPLDLFPEHSRCEGVTCQRADVGEGLPLADSMADLLICQEGIEHFSDAASVLKEFNRVLRRGGRLVVTTPSRSCLASKLSFLLAESETMRRMPPNEYDDVWRVKGKADRAIYHGHIFLLGLQELRVLARLAGFRVLDVRYVRASRLSVLLFPFLYPLILLQSAKLWFRHARRDPEAARTKACREQLRFNVSPAQLVNRNLFVVFEKECDVQDVDFGAGYLEGD